MPAEPVGMTRLNRCPRRRSRSRAPVCLAALLLSPGSASVGVGRARRVRRRAAAGSSSCTPRSSGRRGSSPLSLTYHSCESRDLADEFGGESGRYEHAPTCRERRAHAVARACGRRGGPSRPRGATATPPVCRIPPSAPSSARRSALPVVHVAVEGRTELPGGSDALGSGRRRLRACASTGGSLDAAAMVLATADLTSRFPLKVHANVGWAFHRNEDDGRRLFPDSYPAMPGGGSWSDNDALLLRGAVEFPGRNVVLFTEYRGDILVRPVSRRSQGEPARRHPRRARPPGRVVRRPRGSR